VPAKPCLPRRRVSAPLSRVPWDPLGLSEQGVGDFKGPKKTCSVINCEAPSNLSPPLQVCFLVKRSRGTLAMPPARRLWPEAPRRSRFRFFLPF
jgi:hypothetical protein